MIKLWRSLSHVLNEDCVQLQKKPIEIIFLSLVRLVASWPGGIDVGRQWAGGTLIYQLIPSSSPEILFSVILPHHPLFPNPYCTRYQSANSSILPPGWCQKFFGFIVIMWSRIHQLMISQEANRFKSHFLFQMFIVEVIFAEYLWLSCFV